MLIETKKPTEERACCAEEELAGGRHLALSPNSRGESQFAQQALKCWNWTLNFSVPSRVCGKTTSVPSGLSVVKSQARSPGTLPTVLKSLLGAEPAGPGTAEAAGFPHQKPS